MTPSDLRVFESTNLKNTISLSPAEKSDRSQAITLSHPSPLGLPQPWVCPPCSAPSCPCPCCFVPACAKTRGSDLWFTAESRKGALLLQVPAGLQLPEPCTPAGLTHCWALGRMGMVTHGCQEVSGGDKSEPAQPEELQVCPLISNARMKHLVLGCFRGVVWSQCWWHRTR